MIAVPSISIILAFNGSTFTALSLSLTESKNAPCIYSLLEEADASLLEVPQAASDKAEFALDKSQ
uniref:Uncharacterized protein MANES_04G036700 n=1 Tax=Rhizophora mucronata TaxID=61149 RepID=A0A2P2KAP2_RHIMU